MPNIPIIAYRQGKFAFPNRNPGFDPSHPAARGIVNKNGFSAIAFNKGAIDLVSGQVGSNVGTINPLIKAPIGYAIQASNSSYVSFTGRPTTNADFTFAAIVFLATTPTTSIIASNTSVGTNGVNISTGSNAHLIISAQNVANADSGIALTAGSWFLAGSHKGSTNNFVALRLDTGQIRTATVTQALASGAPNGSYAFGTASNFPGTVTACVMFSNTYLSASDLYAWAADPWSFWYPPAFAGDYFIPHFTPLVGFPVSSSDWNDNERQLRAWFDQTWTQNLLETTLQPPTVATLPPGEIVYDLPVKSPYRIDQTWTWRQVGMLGQDILPTGEQITDLTPKPPSRLPLYTWEWRQVGMLGQDQLPVGEQVYDLTGRPWRLEQTWTLNLQETTLQPFVVPQQIIVRWSYALPQRGPTPIDPTWVWNQTPMLGQDVLPKNQFDWPLPGRPSRLEQTTTWNQTPMLGRDRLPVGAQIHVLWTKAPPPIDQTWTWRQTIMLGKDILPENQYDWPVPRPDPRTNAYRSWEWRQVGMLGQDQLPVGAQSYDRPIPAPARAVLDWIQSVNNELLNPPAVGPLGVVANQYDWPLTPAPKQPALGWAWRQVDKIGLDKLPFNQFDWPLPNRGPAQFTRDWSWRQVGMLGQDKLPTGQQVFDLPNTGPLRAADLRSWIESVNLALTVKPPVPLNQFDWPLPKTPAPLNVSYYWNLTNLLPTPVLPVTIARSSTDLPQRGPFQPDRSSTYTSPFIPAPPVPTVGAQYFLLQPHYIFDRLLPSWTIVTEGVEIPFGWVPTLMVDPLNAQAVAAFYAAGPRTGYPGPGYDWQGFQHFTAQRQSAIQSPVTHWVQSSPGQFKLTGLGASLPPVGE